MWPTLGDTARISLITRRSRVAGSPPQRVAGFDRRIRRLGPETPRPVPSLPRSGWSDQTLSGALARYNRLMVNTVLTVGIITSNRELRRTIKQITRNGVETAPGSSDWFTGTVFIDTVAAPSNGSRLSASSVHFTPRSRTAWHTHPNGQTIYVTEGIGLAQRRSEPIEVIRPGDRVFFEPGEERWHGAAPNRFMTHLAMLEVDDEGNPAIWGDHVTDEEYAARTTEEA